MGGGGRGGGGLGCHVQGYSGEGPQSNSRIAPASLFFLNTGKLQSGK